MPTEGDTEEAGRDREADPEQDGGASDGGASEAEAGPAAAMPTEGGTEAEGRDPDEADPEPDGGASDGGASEAGRVADADDTEAERETKIDAFLRGRHEDEGTKDRVAAAAALAPFADLEAEDVASKKRGPAAGSAGAAAKRARTDPGEDKAVGPEDKGASRRELESLRAQNLSFIETLRAHNRRIDSILRSYELSTGKGEKPAALDGNQSFGATETYAVGGDDCDDDGKVAELAALPKTLAELWDEYDRGLGGRKAAKDFNDEERERVKSGYYRRNQFWSKVSEMVECGMTSSEAIERIQAAYGRKRMSAILDDLRMDRVRGKWPPLLQITDVVKTISASSKTKEVSSVDAIAAASAATATGVAELSQRPRDLGELWEEYDVGLRGKKAAKYFTRQERNRGEVQTTYNKRKQFWSKVSDMVSEGWTADEAIGRVYQAYGRGTSLTTILLNMRRDKKNGWPLPLRAVGEDHYLIARESDNSHLIAALSKRPKTLYDLWTEYTVGSGGRKPAKQFTSLERTRVKDNYYRRNKFWKKVEAMMKNGWSSDDAIDRIYQAYGRKSTVSAIVNKLIKHDKGGGPALLQTNTKYDCSEKIVGATEV